MDIYTLLSPLSAIHMYMHLEPISYDWVTYQGTHLWEDQFPHLMLTSLHLGIGSVDMSAGAVIVQVLFRWSNFWDTMSIVFLSYIEDIASQ